MQGPVAFPGSVRLTETHLKYAPDRKNRMLGVRPWTVAVIDVTDVRFVGIDRFVEIRVGSDRFRLGARHAGPAAASHRDPAHPVAASKRRQQRHHLDLEDRPGRALVGRSRDLLAIPDQTRRTSDGRGAVPALGPLTGTAVTSAASRQTVRDLRDLPGGRGRPRPTPAPGLLRGRRSASRCAPAGNRGRTAPPCSARYRPSAAHDSGPRRSRRAPPPRRHR